MLINVDLNRDGNITQMEEALLEKRTGHDDNLDPDGSLHDSADWIEYWFDGRCVHRSCHVTVHKMPAGMEGVAAKLFG